MLNNIELDQEHENVVNIKVAGVGGAGGNAVNRMCDSNMRGVEFISINTDTQALNNSKSTYKLRIGEKKTNGHGAGGNPEVGELSAEESRDAITEMLKNTNMLFITAGMGGGTGTGAAPVIGAIAKEMGILTIGVVTKPFAFEGKPRMRAALSGIERMLGSVDALLVIPNDKLKEISKDKLPMSQAFAMADSVLQKAVQSISDLLYYTGHINLDFADICTVMKDSGLAHMGIGSGKGETMAVDAARNAISSPLLETELAGANAILLNFIINNDTDDEVVYEASELIRDAANEDCQIMFGIYFDETGQMADDEMRITVIATKFDNANPHTATATNTFTAQKTQNIQQGHESYMQQQQIPQQNHQPTIQQQSYAQQPQQPQQQPQQHSAYQHGYGTPEPSVLDSIDNNSSMEVLLKLLGGNEEDN